MNGRSDKFKWALGMADGDFTVFPFYISPPTLRHKLPRQPVSGHILPPKWLLWFAFTSKPDWQPIESINFSLILCRTPRLARKMLPLGGMPIAKRLTTRKPKPMDHSPYLDMNRDITVLRKLVRAHQLKTHKPLNPSRNWFETASHDWSYVAGSAAFLKSSYLEAS